MERAHMKTGLIVLLSALVLILGGLLLRKEKPAAEAQEERPKAEAKEAGEKREGGEKEEKGILLSPAAQNDAGLKVEEAQTRIVAETIQVTGAVQPNDSRVAQVRLLARGRVLKVNVRIGDRVQTGQELLSYDNIEMADLIAQHVRATEELKKARTEAELLKRAYERAQRLTQIGAIAGAEEERRKAEYDNALATVNSNEAEVRRTTQQLARFGIQTDADARTTRSTVKAPFSGTVTEVKAAEGELKTANEELFTITDLATIWVQADVYERDIAAVKAGRKVAVTVDAYPERTFLGKVTYVSDVLDPKTRTAKVRCEVGNPHQDLKVGMFANVALPAQGSRQALAVPEGAVQTIDGKPVVFVREGENFERRNVLIGSRTNGWVEIKQGVKAGETFVTEGSYSLKSELLKGQIGGGEEGEKK